MAVTWKVLQVEPPSEKVPPPGVATIEVDFGDGTPVYRKRMMADVSSSETLKSAVEGWLTDYLPARPAPAAPVSDDVARLVGQVHEF